MMSPPLDITPAESTLTVAPSLTAVDTSIPAIAGLSTPTQTESSPSPTNPSPTNTDDNSISILINPTSTPVNNPAPIQNVIIFPTSIPSSTRTSTSIPTSTHTLTFTPEPPTPTATTNSFIFIPTTSGPFVGFNVSSVNLNGSGSAVTVSAGASVVVTYNFRVFNNSSCPSCITQLVTGLGAP